MKNNSTFLTRKEQQRAEFEDHFYAIWPNYLDSLNLDQLDYLNKEKLADVGACHPETLLWLKSEVLLRMAWLEDGGTSKSLAAAHRNRG